MQYTVICCIVWQAGRPTPSGDLLCAQEHVGKKTKALRKQVNNGVRRSYFMCICYFKDFLHSWVHIYIIEWLCQFLVCGWLINFMYFWPVSTVLLLALTVVLFICLLVEDEFLLWSLIATRELLCVGFTWFSTKNCYTKLCPLYLGYSVQILPHVEPGIGRIHTGFPIFWLSFIRGNWIRVSFLSFLFLVV